jgi:hypothetical protein
MFQKQLYTPPYLLSALTSKARSLRHLMQKRQQNPADFILILQ